MTHRFAVRGVIAGLAIAAWSGVGLGAATKDTAAPAGCSRKPVVVDYRPNARYADILRHAWRAEAAGSPTVLHVDRSADGAHRTAALRGIPLWSHLDRKQREDALRRQGDDPTEWQGPHDRDEYPPNISEEGGSQASVWYVDASENRSAGAVLASEIAGVREGGCFRYENRPGPKR